MVRLYRSEHVYPEPPEIPLFAYFIRYPNPFARHVLTVDVLDRYINPTTGQIHTKRLILKRGILPKWASKWLPSANMSGGRGLDAWIMEESVVDPPGWEGSSNCPDGMRLERDGAGNQDPDYGVQPRLRFRQGNLNHRKVMHIIEGGELCAGPNGSTLHRTSAEIRSDLGGAWSKLIRERIETYGVGRFEVNTDSARKGMSLVMSFLRARQPLSDTAEFYPPPPPAFSEFWPTPTSSLGPTSTGQSPVAQSTDEE